MTRGLRCIINGYGRPCLKIRVAEDREVSVSFRDDETPEEISVFTRNKEGRFTDNVTEDLLNEESNGNRFVPVNDFDDVLRIVDFLTPEQPIEQVDFGSAKRGLIKLGHQTALAEEALYRDQKPAQAFKAMRAKTSIIDAIVEVGHILDGGIDKIKV